MKLSEKLCRESLEEDATEEEIEDELGIIKYVTCGSSLSVDYAPLEISAILHCASFYLTVLTTAITKLRVYETVFYQRPYQTFIKMVFHFVRVAREVDFKYDINLRKWVGSSGVFITLLEKLKKSMETSVWTELT